MAGAVSLYLGPLNDREIIETIGPKTFTMQRFELSAIEVIKRPF